MHLKISKLKMWNIFILISQILTVAPLNKLKISSHAIQFFPNSQLSKSFPVRPWFLIYVLLSLEFYFYEHLPSNVCRSAYGACQIRIYLPKHSWKAVDFYRKRKPYYERRIVDVIQIRFLKKFSRTQIKLINVKVH